MLDQSTLSNHVSQTSSSHHCPFRLIQWHTYFLILGILGKINTDEQHMHVSACLDSSLASSWHHTRGYELKRVFSLRNNLVHQLPVPHFLVWHMGWNRLMHQCIIPHKLITTSTSMRNGVIPINLRNKLIMHHLI